MNTISIETDLVAHFRKTQLLAALAADQIGPAKVWGRGSVPAWLPTPAPKTLPATKPARQIPARQSNRAWIGAASQSPAEKLMAGLLALAGTAGVAYGFWCILELVQNWAGFHAGVTQLIR